MAAPVISDLDPTLVLVAATVGTPVLIDADVTVSDADEDYDGGTLVVSGVRASDTLAILDQGPGAGHITFNVATGDVSWGGVIIGVAAGGTGVDLIVTFNAAATSASIEALIETLTFSSASSAVTDVGLTFTLTDASGAGNVGPLTFVFIDGAHDPLPNIYDGRAGTALFDVDGDGDLDLVLGDFAHTGLRYFENVGDIFNPDFLERTGGDNPFGESTSAQAKPFAYDLDGDGDFDLIVGDVGGTVSYLENVGGVFHARTGAANPFDGIQAPDGYSTVALADIDGDGLADLLLGQNYGALTYFRNTGTAGHAAFTQQTGAANPFEAITLPNFWMTPTFVDFDGDGDFDLDLGTYGGHHYYENTGTAAAPVFVERTGAANPFAGFYNSNAQVTFADLDGDGKLDALVSGASVAYYHNATASGAPVTVSIQSNVPQIIGAPGMVMVLENSGLQLMGFNVTVTDPVGGLAGGQLTVTGLLSEDSVSILGVGTGLGEIDYDLATGDVTYEGQIIGHAAGGANGTDFVISFTAAADAVAVEALIERLAFANSETDPVQTRAITLLLADAGGEVAGDPSGFHGQNSLIGTIGFIAVNYPAPALGDLDGDGDLDMLVGDSSGAVHFFLNTGTAEAANFVEQPPFLPFFGVPYVSAGYASPALGDLDGDGDLDLIVGDDDGNLHVYENLRSGPAGPLFSELIGAANPFDGITTDSIGGVAIADIDGDGLNDVMVGSVDGDIRYFHNTGTLAQAAFTELTGAANPFDGITGIGFTAPVIADVDGDGDFDLFLGDYGTGQYFENTGSATAPVFTPSTNIVPDAMPGWQQRGVFGDLNGDGRLDLLTASGQYLTLYTQGNQGVTVDVFINLTLSAPTLTLTTNSFTFDENVVNAAPQLLGLGALLDDADGTQFPSFLSVTGVLPEETISIRNQGTGAGQVGYDAVYGDVTYGGVLVGNFCGCVGDDVTLLFTAGATNAAVQAVLNNLTYANTSDDPTASHDLYISFIDGFGMPLAVPAQIAFEELTGLDNLLGGIDLGANAMPVTAFVGSDGLQDLVVRDSTGKLVVFENDGFGLTLLDPASNPLAGADTGTNGPYLLGDIENDGDLDLIRVEGQILRVYENVGGTFIANPALSAIDGTNVGSAYSLSRPDFNTLLVGRTDGTIATLYFDFGLNSFVEQVGAANPFNLIDVGDNAALAFGDLDQDGDQDLVVGGADGQLHFYRNDGGVYVAQTGANDPFAGIDVGDNAAPALIDGDNDGFVDVLIVGAADGQLYSFANVTSNPVIFTINITAQGDAQDDDIATAENQTLAGSLFADNGHGIDDAGMTITLLGGAAFVSGGTITLASGALLTLNADGSFIYDPHGQFDYLADAASGAVNTSATDSFTYETSTGSTATVTIQISGVDSSRDVLQGTGLNDVIDGGIGNDTLYGGVGEDVLYGGIGGDYLFGGADNDVVYGGDGADKLYGEDGDDVLNGGDGQNRFDGGAGDDVLNGGSANDYFDGGTGADVMAGLLGNDVYIVDNIGDQTNENPGEGYDIVRTDLDGWVLAANIEGLELQGTGNINGTGNAEANNLQGNSGNNTLDGGAGVDTISGNDGDDIIIGGLGNDLLRGGAGADTFVVAHAFGPVLETDQVYDFNALEGDKIDLSGAYAGTLRLVGAFTKHAGEMTLGFAAGITTLKLDINGDGKADYQMKINGDVTGESSHWLL